MKRIALVVMVMSLVAVPAALADSTVLNGYGSSAAKPVVQVKGSTEAGTATEPADESLPFTGTDLAVFLVGGTALVAFGLGLRRLGKDRS